MKSTIPASVKRVKITMSQYPGIRKNIIHPVLRIRYSAQTILEKPSNAALDEHTTTSDEGQGGDAQ
jgi:hypothetical protein